MRSFMKARCLGALLALLALTPGCQPAPPAPPPPQAAEDARCREARNYVGHFRTVDTAKWEWAKDRLVKLGPAVIPVLLEAMERDAGEVDLCCADVLRRMGPDALPALDREIRKGDAGAADKALARRRAFRRSLIAILEGLPDPRAAQVLCRVLNEDPWPTARRNAAFCLSIRKDPEAVGALISALGKDPDEGVRAAARAGLRKRAGRDLGPNPEVWEAWLKSPH